MFSRKFATFLDWYDAKSRTSGYAKRIINYVATYPGATLAEARGHRPGLGAPDLGEFPSTPKLVAPKQLYVCSWGMHDVPIETNVDRNNYYGFLLQAWSYDEDYLQENKYTLKSKFLELVEEYIGHHESEWWFSNPVFWGSPMPTNDWPSLDDTWEFIVEKETGEAIWTRKGYISRL